MLVIDVAFKLLVIVDGIEARNVNIFPQAGK